MMKHEQYVTHYIQDYHGEYNIKAIVPPGVGLDSLIDLGRLEEINAHLAETVTAEIKKLAPYLSDFEYSTIYQITAAPIDHLIYLDTLIAFATTALATVSGDDTYFDYYPCFVHSIAEYADALDRKADISPLIQAIFALGSPYHHTEGFDNCTDIFGEYLSHLTTDPLPRQLVYG